jgi:hypothetical protein
MKAMERMREDYNVRYRRFSQRIEHIIIALIVLLSLSLAIGGFFYQFEPIRKFFVETERLEGIPHVP